MFITNKNIAESLVRSLQNSFNSQTNCEITLMCDGKNIKCHRHVLVLHSIHFSNLFKEQKDFPNTIAVVNMKFNHLKAILDYMYFGRIKLQEDSDEMNQIIKCAEDLGLSALVTFITDFLKSSSKHKLNGSSGNLSNSVLNGDEVLVKRKRTSDIDNTPRVHDKKRKPEVDNVKLKGEEADRIQEEAVRKAEEKKKQLEEEEAIRKAEEKKKLQEEEAARKAAEKKKEEQEAARKAEEKRRQQEEEEAARRAEEKKKQEEEAARKVAEKKRQQEEEEAARKAEEEKNKKTTKCDESASTKSCAVCNKQYKDNIDHKKLPEGYTFDKKCVVPGCGKSLPFRRALNDHLLRAHKLDVCDG